MGLFGFGKKAAVAPSDGTQPRNDPKMIAAAVADLHARKADQRTAALGTLQYVTKTELLVPHAAAIVALIADPDRTYEAQRLFSKMPPDARARHAPALVDMMKSSNLHVRACAKKAFNDLPPEARVRHVGALLAMLSHKHFYVQIAATESFGLLPPEARGALLAMFSHKDDGVRRAAAERFGLLPPEARVAHAGALLAMFSDKDDRVRRAAAESFDLLPPEARGAHAGALLAMFSDKDDDVKPTKGKPTKIELEKVQKRDQAKYTAVQRFGKLPQEVLVPHAATLFALAADSNPAGCRDHSEHNRRSALCSHILDAIGSLPPQALVPHAATLLAYADGRGTQSAAARALNKQPAALMNVAVEYLWAKRWNGEWTSGDAISACLLALPSLAERVASDVSADPASWGAAPERLEQWSRPATLVPVKPVVELFKCMWTHSDGGTTVKGLQRSWEPLAPVGQRALEALVDSIRSRPASIRVLHDVFEKERRGSLDKYRAQLERVHRGANCPEYLELSRTLRQKLEPRRPECKQSVSDFPQLISQAVALTERYRAFVDMLSTKTGAKASQAPLKGPWRALEKMVLRPEHKPGGETDASLLCDCLRGALNCNDFIAINSVVEMLTWLDDELGEEARVEGIDARFRIRLIRLKCRFSTPTSGGWADLLVNFRFADDPSRHVCELQVQHETLLRVRTEGNAHEKYNSFRSAFEILETIGKPPEDKVDKELLQASVERKAAPVEVEADSSRVAALERKVAALLAALEESKAATENKVVELEEKLSAALERLAKLENK